MELADEAGVDVLVVAGDVVGEPPLPVLSLTDRFGGERAMADATGCVAQLLSERLA